MYVSRRVTRDLDAFPLKEKSAWIGRRSEEVLPIQTLVVFAWRSGGIQWWMIVCRLWGLGGW